ncbi:MAG: stage II sporulation protein M, partial [Thermoproteota archaeon]|nr:stage II sporulation protein M [Thermoproteota archaeon]
FQLGFSIKLDKSFSEELSENFKNQIQGIDEIGIFLNNIKIALVMFIPILGIVVGSFSAFSTGLIFNSIVSLSNANFANPLIVFLTPFGILELVSYGLAISRGGIFLYEILKKSVSKKSITYLFVEIGLVAVMLFVGALIEWSMIENIPNDLL